MLQCKFVCSTGLYIISYLTFLFSKVLRALIPCGHNDPVCLDVDNCDKKTRNIYFTNLLHEMELVNTMSDNETNFILAKQVFKHLHLSIYR